MFVAYRNTSGTEYATLCRSVRKGDKVARETISYLGKVVDKDRGIYQNRKCGTFSYDPDTDTYD